MTGRRRPDYWPRLTTGLTIDRHASLAAKYVVAIAAGLPGRDPAIRQLNAALPFADETILGAIRELHASGLARVERRPGRRSVIHPAGLALPGKKGRRHFATIPPRLFHAALAAGSGRKAAYGPLVIQRLLREQAKRGAAHVSPVVLAADLGIKANLAAALLDALESADVIERHRSHGLDSDELRVYSVPLADALYAIDTGRLDAEQTRILDAFELSGHRLTVLGPRIDLDALYSRIVDVRAEFSEEAIAATVGRIVAANLTAETLLAETLLNALWLTAASVDTDPGGAA